MIKIKNVTKIYNWEKSGRWYIAVFSGMLLGIVFIILMVEGFLYQNQNMFIYIELISLTIINLLLWKVLKNMVERDLKK